MGAIFVIGGLLVGFGAVLRFSAENDPKDEPSTATGRLPGAYAYATGVLLIAVGLVEWLSTRGNLSFENGVNAGLVVLGLGLITLGTHADIARYRHFRRICKPATVVSARKRMDNAGWDCRVRVTDDDVVRTLPLLRYGPRSPLINPRQEPVGNLRVLIVRVPGLWSVDGAVQQERLLWWVGTLMASVPGSVALTVGLAGTWTVTDLSERLVSIFENASM